MVTSILEACNEVLLMHMMRKQMQNVSCVFSKATDR